MASKMNPEQKKQAAILLVLVAVLAGVFFFIDPFNVMKKTPTPVVTQQPATVQPTETAGQPNATTDTPQPKVARVDQVELIKANVKHLDLLPPINQIHSAYAYKFNPFDLTAGGKVTELKDEVHLPTIRAIRGIGTFRVIFNNVQDSDPNRAYSEGETFKYKGQTFRILEIDQGKQTVKVVNENGQTLEIKRN